MPTLHHWMKEQPNWKSTIRLHAFKAHIGRIPGDRPPLRQAGTEEHTHFNLHIPEMPHQNHTTTPTTATELAENHFHPVGLKYICKHTLKPFTALLVNGIQQKQFPFQV